MTTLLTLNIKGGLGPLLRPLITWLAKQDADILCLQECARSVVPWLQHHLDGIWEAVYAPATHHGNAILSRLPFRESRCLILATSGSREVRSAVDAIISLPAGALRVCCTHFDHVREDCRLAQWEALSVETSGIAGGVLCGDLNALWRADYTDAEWARIAAERSASHWEPPRSRLMGAIFGAGFIDAAVVPAPTSRFNTRIDYILAAVDCPWRLTTTTTLPALDDGVTDHNGIVTTVVRR